MTARTSDLTRLQKWPLPKDVMGFLDCLKGSWNSDYGSIIIKGKKVLRVELHTGGWSENEEVIGALQHSMFWVFYWAKSVRGGHYYFRIRLTRGGAGI